METQDIAGQASMDTVQHNITNIQPTASEIGYLWSSYYAETMSVCMLKYILSKSKDPDIRPVFQQALDTSSQRVQSIEALFNSFYHPLPEAFGERDVDINAGELFSETYWLSYTKLMNEYILNHYSKAFSLATLSSIIDFFSDAIITSRDIINIARDVLLPKGLFVKTPYITIPDRIDFVNDKDYYGSIFGSKRPLHSLEISYIFDALRSILTLSALETGFAQVTKDEKVKKHLSRGKQIVNKQEEILSNLLKEANLPIPTSADFEVTTSRESPFRDKLILFHDTIVNSFKLLDFGRALTNSARKDVISTFVRLTTETLEFSKDATDILIENKWLERLPEAADRKELMQ